MPFDAFSLFVPVRSRKEQRERAARASAEREAVRRRAEERRRAKWDRIKQQFASARAR